MTEPLDYTDWPERPTEPGLGGQRRTDQAYEDLHRQEFVKWKSALTWGEYFTWQLNHWRFFLLGAGVAIGTVLLIRMPL